MGEVTATSGGREIEHRERGQRKRGTCYRKRDRPPGRPTGKHENSGGGESGDNDNCPADTGP
jgi:hypothetical protein